MTALVGKIQCWRRLQEGVTPNLTPDLIKGSGEVEACQQTCYAWRVH